MTAMCNNPLRTQNKAKDDGSHWHSQPAIDSSARTHNLPGMFFSSLILYFTVPYIYAGRLGQIILYTICTAVCLHTKKYCLRNVVQCFIHTIYDDDAGWLAGRTEPWYIPAKRGARSGRVCISNNGRTVYKTNSSGMPNIPNVWCIYLLAEAILQSVMGRPQQELAIARLVKDEWTDDGG